MSDQQDSIVDRGTKQGKIEAQAEGPTQKFPMQGPDLDERWLENFYKECGREVTLAYTTLNQMKNWAMLIAAAAISGLSFGTSAEKYPNVPMFTGVVLVYTFILRFYFRAILCYINLGRWNRLQSGCVALKLVGKPQKTGSADTQDLTRRLREDIQTYYHEWLSPYDRKTQLLSPLKLGFGLLFALPLFFLVHGVASLWSDFMVKGLTTFAVGVTVVELNDFFKSKFFDDVRAYEGRKSRGKIYETFPVPASRGWYIVSWVSVLILSVVIARWPKIGPWLRTIPR
jgi:hypothetical protein